METNNNINELIHTGPEPLENMFFQVILQSQSDTHLVSTIQFLPPSLNPGRYETMVFAHDGTTVDWFDLEARVTDDKSSAAINHIELCRQFTVHPERKATIV